MSFVTLRISEATREKLRELAVHERQPMYEIVERAIEEYRRRRFLAAVNAAFAALKADPEAWREELEERAVWDATIGDGFRDE